MYIMAHPYKEMFLKECSRFLYADMGRSPNQKASQLVKYRTCEPVKLHGKRTGNLSINMLTLVSFGMDDGYGKDARVTLTFYFNHFHICFTTRNFRRQEIDGVRGRRIHWLLLFRRQEQCSGEAFLNRISQFQILSTLLY